MLNQNFGRYLSKLLEVLMHLRIDVKKDETEHFQKLLIKKKKSEVISKNIGDFFDFIVIKDLYDISNKAVKKHQNIVTIKVTFAFRCRQTKLSQMA